MKVAIRNELDLDKPINLRKLSPIMKIYAGIMAKWRESKTYKTNLSKNMEAAHYAAIQREERLKDMLLAIVYRELMTNTSLVKSGEKCIEIIVSVEQEYEDALYNIVKSKDFLPYDITFIEENADIRKAFRTMPILISVKKKKL